jgi:hypothetical protein
MWALFAGRSRRDRVRGTVGLSCVRIRRRPIVAGEIARSSISIGARSRRRRRTIASLVRAGVKETCREVRVVFGILGVAKHFEEA